MVSGYVVYILSLERLGNEFQVKRKVFDKAKAHT